MQENYKHAFIVIGMLILSACGTSDMDGGDQFKTAHHFSDVECFEGFYNDLMVVLQNDKIWLEVSQLQPKQNT